MLRLVLRVDLAKLHFRASLRFDGFAFGLPCILDQITKGRQSTSTTQYQSFQIEVRQVLASTQSFQVEVLQVLVSTQSFQVEVLQVLASTQSFHGK